MVVCRLQCVCVIMGSVVCFVIPEQDRGLDQLSQALRRQREVGLAIQDEVVEQNGKICYLASSIPGPSLCTQ